MTKVLYARSTCRGQSHAELDSLPELLEEIRRKDSFETYLENLAFIFFRDLVVFHAYNLLIGEDFAVFFRHHLSFYAPSGASDTFFEPELFTSQPKGKLQAIQIANQMLSLRVLIWFNKVADGWT
jgi:hypothetical protein